MDCWIYGWMARSTARHIFKHTCTNLEKVDGHCHLSTCDVSSKLLAHSAEWKIANLRKKGGGKKRGGREIILQILLLHYTNPYSCEWCQKKFVTKINLKKKKKTLQTQFIDNNK